jgi:hypothetical protein
VIFTPEDLTQKARNLIVNTYHQANLPLPQGWDNSEVLTSLAAGLARNDFDLATQPQLRQQIYDLSPTKNN